MLMSCTMVAIYGLAQVTISGKVKDNRGRGIIGASVSLKTVMTEASQTPPGISNLLPQRKETL